MPAFTPDRQKMQHFYRFHFHDDGYPGRMDDDGTVFAHPIYWAYILRDYLTQHEESPTPELRDAIRIVAKASISRMDEIHGTLVFWYAADPERGLRLYERHYSGLTQGYYATALHRAGELLEDQDIIDAAGQVFAALMLDTDDGGVKYRTPHGPMIAEVPQRPNSWILNGWQTALVSAHEYADISGSSQAAQFVTANLQAMSEMLPLFDSTETANSRYGLSGHVPLRLVFHDQVERVENVTLTVPGEVPVDMPRLNGSPWQPSIHPDDVSKAGAPASKTIRLNGVLSVASAPDPNQLTLDITASQSTRVRLEVELGEYDPLRSAPVKRSWAPVATATLAPGMNPLSFDIERAVIERVVIPTNFAKVIDGEQVNIYHPIHIRQLRRLGSLDGGGALLPWADKFEGYICAWSDMDLYAGLNVRGPGGEQIDDPSTWC